MTGRVKKLFGLLLCMVLLVCLMPVSAMAEGTMPDGATAPSGITADYDGQPHKPYVDAVVPDGFTVTYTNGDDITEPGKYTVGWAISDGTGTVASGSVVSYIYPVVNEAPQAKSGLVYDATAQELVDAGSAKDGKGVMYYSLDNSTWSESIPKATDAGDYTVYYKVVSPGLDSSVASLTVNISKYVVTYTGITVEDKVYDGTKAHTYTGTPNMGVLPPNGGWSTSGTAAVSFEDPNVGEDKTLIISGITVLDENGVDITKNFEFVADVTASITPKTVTVTPNSGLSKTYGDADPYGIGFTATGLYGDDELTGKLSRQSGENVGNYRITIGTLANPNYKISLTEAYFTINPLQLTSSNTTVTVKDYVYDGASHNGLVSVKLGDKELVEGTDFTVKGAEAYTLGSHKLTIEGKGNYSGTVTATWKLSLPAIAKKVTDGTITKDNVLTDLTADKIRELVVLDEALAGIKNNADATEAEKQEAEAVAAALKPIMDVLEGKAGSIVDPIKKWLEENLPKADADELEMRKEYEVLQAWLKGDGKAWAEVVEANLGKELKEMKNKLYTYLIIVGNGSHWVTTSSEDLGFRANGHLSLFTYVKVDGKAVPRDSYTLYSGSTIVMLHNEYLKTLDKGWHDIQFVYSDGVTNVGKFQVTDRWVDVQTGDGSDMGLWLSFMVMAGLGMTVCLPRFVRRKNED